MLGNAEKLFTRFLHLSDPWEVTSVKLDDAETRVDIRVRNNGRFQICCPECGGRCTGYDKKEREWQHSDLFDMECHIHCAVDRMKCSKCGKVFMLDVPWAEKGSGFTLLFEARSIALMKDMPVNSASRFLNTKDKTLWRILNRYVDKRMEKQCLKGLTCFYVDETACKRGHRYISVFADDEHRIIFVTYGNDADTVSRFRRHLEEHGGRAEDIEYICCDMGKGFQSGIEREFPGAIVTYDRFHVMEHMSRAVDASRRHEWNVLRENGRLKEATDLKGQRFVLLKNTENLKGFQKSRVDSILENHKEIGIVYSLKESLRDTWSFSKIRCGEPSGGLAGGVD